MNYQPGTADGQSEAVPKGEVPLAEIPAADVSSAEGTGESPSMQPFMDLSPKEMGVLSQMKNTPRISIQKLSELQNLSLKEVRTIVSSLRDKGIIEHIGAKNGGFWKIH